MRSLIVYSSLTGNTKLLAETIDKNIPNSLIIPIKEYNNEAFDRLFIGYWVDKGYPSIEVSKFLKNIHNKEIFMFGTMGASDKNGYGDIIKKNAESLVPEDNKIIGHFVCQGKLNPKLKEIYEKRLENEPNNENIIIQLNNYEESRLHPSKDDLKNLEKELSNLEK